ncbi:MAG: tetratricopeptide repeat protein [Pseudomonadota bacterium]
MSLMSGGQGGARRRGATEAKSGWAVRAYLLASMVVSALLLAGCASAPGEPGPTASADATPEQTIAYARSLSDRGQAEQAAAVLQIAAMRNPESRDLRAAYGKSLIATGQFKEAAQVLANAHTPDSPDASILSAQGVIADNLGDHRAARAYYQRALNIEPNNPAILTNLALSYAMTGNSAEAIRILRTAAALPNATPATRQTLATLLFTQGQVTEAEQLFARDLTPDQARSNIEWLRQNRAGGS